jgi:hypothetical protein
MLPISIMKVNMSLFWDIFDLWIFAGMEFKVSGVDSGLH